ncbi:uncharacterized protein [Gossypium hirsutum]|uniref:Uncharacterized protein n=1 Tax=Gossypium hirsutum TaxID=3635 RepID=A0A1U8PAS1_GOSHI|nr:uncharacterized protein LOC107956168 [Gossypium hirsutum]
MDGVVTGEKVESKEFVDASDKKIPQIVTHMPNVRPSKLSMQSKVSTQADISLPLPIPQKLGIGHMKSIAVTLQLDDRSLGQSEGKIKDVLVRIDKFNFPDDFIILDCEPGKEVTIILGRPFLATGRTLIDVYKGELTMLLNDEQVTFSVFESVQCEDKEECHIVDVLDDLIKEEFNVQSTTLSEEFLIESLDLASRTTPIFKPSIEEAPALELKPLPPHIKYVFLGDHNTLPVIVFATLDVPQEEKLVRILKQHKRAITWSITDIQGISPSFCMHKIKLDDEDNYSGYNQIAIAPADQEKTTFTCPFGTFAFRFELEHKAMWAIKQVNMDYEAAGKKRLLDITKLKEIRRNAYENAAIYKEKTNGWHEKIILQRQFIAGQ